jgi:hypothetical protein
MRTSFIEPKDLQVGYTFKDKYGTFRIMAIVDGYAMARRPNAIPFTITLKAIILRLKSGEATIESMKP